MIPASGILVLALLLGQDLPSVAAFTAFDSAAKRQLLQHLTLLRSGPPVEHQLPLIRAALQDGAADVRVLALAAVGSRALRSRFAGTDGPRVGPAPYRHPAPPTEVVPLAWKDDQRTLREAVHGDCVRLLTSDPDRQVRRYALTALGYLEMPRDVSGRYRDQFIDLILAVYARDEDARLRASIVSALAQLANDTRAIRRAIVTALVAPDSEVRHAGLSAISSQATGGRPKVSFEDARATVVSALDDPRPGVRLGAVRALNVFGAPAVGLVSQLERLRDEDPDPQVRESARLAIESIHRPQTGG